MNVRNLVVRTAQSLALTVLLLAVFGELRPGAAAVFFMITFVVGGLVRDLAAVRSGQ
jgi:hypothetical protein